VNQVQLGQIGELVIDIGQGILTPLFLLLVLKEKDEYKKPKLWSYFLLYLLFRFPISLTIASSLLLYLIPNIEWLVSIMGIWPTFYFSFGIILLLKTSEFYFLVKSIIYSNTGPSDN